MANCLDKDGLLGSLFQQIIADLKVFFPSNYGQKSL